MTRFFIADVFTRTKYTGNQLAVVVDDGQLSTETMQRIAREMNFSETTFVSPKPRDGSFPTRIFAPTRELPFAGHPTIGTAFVIRRHLAESPIRSLTLSVPAGRVPVEFDDNDDAWMQPPTPELGPVHDAPLLARALGLKGSDIDPDFPARTMKSPFPQAFVPIRTLEAIRRARYDSALGPELEQAGVPGSLYLFTRETTTEAAQAHSRLFAPDIGIVEDPATGSAAGSLAFYAASHDYLPNDPLVATIEQGLEMGRPSQLHIRAERTDASWLVKVGGHAVIVAAGELQ